MNRLILLSMILAALAGSAFGNEPPRLRAVATTSIAGDVVKAVAGDGLDLRVLMGAGMDPHTFEPTPRDAAAVAEARLLVVNGAGLETFQERLLDANRSERTRLVDLSEGLPLRHSAEVCPHDHDHAGHDHDQPDPHVWLDPTLVIRWVDTIARVLQEEDPAHADQYQARAEDYRRRLEELDEWIRTTVDRLPSSQRRFVTDHHEFGYFADRYGFTVTGALLPNITTTAESSAREMAQLEEHIRETGTRVLVVGHGINPSLARRVARDTGLQVITLFTGALSPPEGPAATYLDLMRYNVSNLVQALRPASP